jgi:hypothetical protein
VRFAGALRAKHIIAVLAVTLTPIAVLLELGAWTRTVTLSPPYASDGGYAYRVKLDPGPILNSVLSTGGDDELVRSSLRLFEDGRELTAGHANHRLIRERGEGRYSHWDNALHFSASDNSDPNASGRVYISAYPLKVRTWVWTVLAAGLVVSAALWRGEIVAKVRRVNAMATSARRGRAWPLIHVLLLAVSIAVPVGIVILQFGSGRTTAQAIGGIIPWSDSAGWLYGAFRILLTGEASEWTARRPLNVAFLASLLGIAGQSLAVALVIRAALLGAVIYLFFCTVARSFGVVAALAAACIVYGFSYRFLGVALSEVNGVILGTLGITVLLHAAHVRNDGWFGLGLFLLAAGLLVRSGPFFVLPILAIWSGFAWSQSWRPAIRPILLSLSAIAAAWILAKGVALAYMPPDVADNANYSYVFYGLAKGGESWRAFCVDVDAVDPGYCARTTESDRAREAYARAFELIKEGPLLLLRGMFKFMYDYVSQLGIYAPPTIRGILLSIAAAGFLAAIFSRNRPDRRLPVIAFIGCVMSASLIYWSIDAHRAYAATVAFDAWFVAIGIQVLLRGVRGALEGGSIPSVAAPPLRLSHLTPAAIAGLLGVSLVAIAALGPAVLRANPPPLDASSAGTCGLDEVRIVVEMGSTTTYIRLTEKEDAFVPDVNYAKFQRDPGFAGVGMAEFLGSQTVGDMLLFAIDLQAAGQHKYFWITADRGVPIADGGLYSLCIRQVAPDTVGYVPYLYEVVAAHDLGRGDERP